MLVTAVREIPGVLWKVPLWKWWLRFRSHQYTGTHYFSCAQFLKSSLSLPRYQQRRLYMQIHLSNSIFTTQEYMLGCWHLHNFLFDVAFEWQPRKALDSPPVFCQPRKWWRKSCQYFAGEQPSACNTLWEYKCWASGFPGFFPCFSSRL